MELKLCNGMDRSKKPESYNLPEPVVYPEYKHKPLVYGISHHAPVEKPYSIPGINLFFRKKSTNDYKKVLIEAIEQYLPIPYYEFKKLNLDEQQEIIGEIKNKQSKEEQDVFQKKLDKLLEMKR